MAQDPIDPHVSPWHLFGAVMRHCRESRPNLSLRRAALALHVDFSNLARWERGERMPPAELVPALDQVYGAHGILTALYDKLTSPDTVTGSASGTCWANPAYPAGGDDMERRAMLHLLAGLGAVTPFGAVGSFGAQSEPLRQLLDASLGREHRSLEDWELACADHLHAMRTRPPAQVTADLLIDLHALHRQLAAAGPADAVELRRCLAVLSSIQANVLTRLGEHGTALRWWHTARHAADTSGDLDLRLMVRGEEAGHGLYGQRPPEAILQLVRDACELAGGQNVDLLTTEVKALSMLGRHDEALDRLNALHALADKGVHRDPYGFWKLNQLHFAESWVYAAAGAEEPGRRAQESLMKLTQDYQYCANVQLHQALCTVVRGGVDEGTRQAAAVIDALAPGYRTRHILETAHLVLRAVPQAQRHHPAPTDLRQALAADPSGNACTTRPYGGTSGKR
ncbi:hypothetical protein Sru01_27720 [Sphaerisporangium rufum]|uniref:HTH cro/C1-type domain-containing protein n=1 Tax=Sphaerisporangium rufum TaxID=1381558 RepID=A0A919V504_9ACTN|nr:helix-turn-helix transcriptional regulator [Sphaerisporangium rufum]GII77790.1 hypothetical protein Sru01_27720 [Sphaerisporangium rufum]